MGAISNLNALMNNNTARTYFTNSIRNKTLLPVLLVLACVGTSRVGLEIGRLAYFKKIHNRIKKEFSPIASKLSASVESEFSSSSFNCNKTIWTLWYQGEDQASNLSKKCFDSIRKNMPEYDLVVLDAKNISKYVTIPSYIRHKLENGSMTITHYSDIVRIFILTAHGGIWLDSTVFLSDKIPEHYIESDLFMYQTLKPGLDGRSFSISSWFIVAQKPSRILILTKLLLCEYWSRYNALKDYFLLHHLMQLAIEIYPEEWERVIPCDNSTPHILQLRLFEICNNDILDAICKQTSVHKLSNKMDWENMDLSSTYYEGLLARSGLLN